MKFEIGSWKKCRTIIWRILRQLNQVSYDFVQLLIEASIVSLTCLQVVPGFPLSLLFARLKRPPSSYTSWVVGTWPFWYLCPVFQCPWSRTYRIRHRIVGDTNACRHQAELQCAGHAPNVTNVQFALFTLGTCCCLMFYLACPVTPVSLQQCVPSLHWCLGLFCPSCTTWHLRLLNFRRLLLIQSPGFWTAPVDSSSVCQLFLQIQCCLQRLQMCICL